MAKRGATWVCREEHSRSGELESERERERETESSEISYEGGRRFAVGAGYVYFFFTSFFFFFLFFFVGRQGSGARGSSMVLGDDDFLFVMIRACGATVVGKRRKG
jgi:hypothetical protein